MPSPGDLIDNVSSVITSPGLIFDAEYILLLKFCFALSSAGEDLNAL